MMFTILWNGRSRGNFFEYIATIIHWEYHNSNFYAMKFRFTFTTSSGNEKILQDDPRGFRWGNKDINPRRAFSQVNVVWE